MTQVAKVFRCASGRCSYGVRNIAGCLVYYEALVSTVLCCGEYITLVNGIFFPICLVIQLMSVSLHRTSPRKRFGPYIQAVLVIPGLPVLF